MSTVQPTVTNISTYLFAPLENLKGLRDHLRQVCRDWSLKGTILLSTEGINLFVAGPAERIDQLVTLLRAVPGLGGLTPKISLSEEQPFSRMLVKIKKEIISFGVEGIDPVNKPAPRLSAQELKRWLDEGKPVTLLDTRNDYEVNLGTFQGAIPIGVRTFRDFPAATARLQPLPKDQPIVTFCTGGIRCEKAAPYMINQGFENVFQLDGGILKYFEECGNHHYQGECFVFDKRVGLAGDLGESGQGMCYACQAVLSPAEMADPRTVEGVSCPRCHKSPEESRKDSMARHREKLRHVTREQPGKHPRDNFRPLKIPARFAGFTLIDFLSAVFDHISRPDWLARIQAGDMVNEQFQPVAAEHRVQPGERYFTRERAQIEPDVNLAIDILHEDEALIIVHKPAPLPMHPSGRFNRNTLASILREVYDPEKPRPAHRLDANTSGLAVFTRKGAFAKVLQPAFERGEVEKTYLARVTGHPSGDTFSCEAPISATAGECGSRVVDPENGLPASTAFQVLNRLPDGTALLRVTPHTGRTNQIRVHLWHLGFPILGDTLYLPGRVLGDTQTITTDQPPLHLFAWKLKFRHPVTCQWELFQAPLPDWASGVD